MNAEDRSEFERILSCRGGQRGQIVVDDPSRLSPDLTRPWPRYHRDGPIEHFTVLHVLNDRGRAYLAEVADATQWRRSWGYHLVRTWLGAWREYESYRTYVAAFPSMAVPGAVDLKPQATPPIRGGDDTAASLLWKHRFDHAAALVEITPWEHDLPEARDYWRVRTNLMLAPLSVNEALAAWPRR